MQDYGLKLSYEEIKHGTENKWLDWRDELTSFVNQRLSEDNVKNDEVVGESQKEAWIDSFKFIRKYMDLENMNPTLIFEYILPLTVYKRPDVIIPTKNKVIVLEFKRKDSPEKSDIKQAIRYREWLKNHHAVSREKEMEIETYLVCTTPNADTNNTYQSILNRKNFNNTIYDALKDEEECDFLDEWCESNFTVLPSMLEAIYEVYKTGNIPYLSDINENCLNQVNKIIDDARENNKKALILISGVPGAGKTAIGQSVVFQQNKEKPGSAIYLSGNGPLVEVLQYEINKATGEKNAGENAILGIKNFKTAYFDDKSRKNNKVPQQSILIFDEAQRAWDTEKMGRRGFSEPEGLLRVGDKIFDEHGFAVIIGLYGNGQVIYTGEEKGMDLWNDALNEHPDWEIFVPENLSDGILKSGKNVKDGLFLSVSIRADFVDCSPWVESVITRENIDFEKEKIELEKLNNSPLELYVTRDFGLIKKFTKELDMEYPEIKYGLLISNFAEAKILTKRNGWVLGYGKWNNQVKNGKYGSWFDHECKELTKAASVYGNQGLELDYPIVIFGGDYVLENSKWISRGYWYDRAKNQGDYENPDQIVENNYRVLLTRARKGMILFIPPDKILDETYQHFVDMGVDILE